VKFRTTSSSEDSRNFLVEYPTKSLDIVLALSSMDLIRTVSVYQLVGTRSERKLGRPYTRGDDESQRQSVAGDRAGSDHS
jgi:hypothetical protein